jgi:hypothetical protein
VASVSNDPERPDRTLTGGHTPADTVQSYNRVTAQNSMINSPPYILSLAPATQANTSTSATPRTHARVDIHNNMPALLSDSDTSDSECDEDSGVLAAVRGKPKSIIRQSQLRTVVEPLPKSEGKRVHYSSTAQKADSGKAPAPGETFVRHPGRVKTQNEAAVYPQPTARATKPTSTVGAPLPPTYFCAHLLAPTANPLWTEKGSKVVAHVDSGCKPFSIISDALASEAQLVLVPHPTRLRLADKVTVVKSEYMVEMTLRVTILDHPRLFDIKAVVWPASKCVEPLIIGQADALRTGLSIFVHDNSLREVILGQQALYERLSSDSIPDVPDTVATIVSPEEDQELLERISPIEGLRAAMAPAGESTDAWVTEFLNSDLAELFGPLSPQPARVPFLNFDVNESAIKQRTYGTTIPIRMPPAAPRKQDSIDAHAAELLEYNAIQMAYPDLTPGPIASVGFTVNKAGVVPRPRPPDMEPRALQEALRKRQPLHDFKQRLNKEQAEYVESLTSDRFVVSFKPVNDVTLVQHYPTPTVQENLLKLSRFKFFASIDLRKAFWSIGVAEHCRKYLYTIAPGGIAFFWLRAPMGHSAVPGHFQFCMDGLLFEYRSFAFAFADDIIIGANSPSDLKANIRAVLQKLLDANFRVNAQKCQFEPRTSIQYLGWRVGNGQVLPTEPFLDKLWRLKKPCDIRGSAADKRSLVKRFLGTVQYLGSYIPYAADELGPLHALSKLKDKSQPDGQAVFNWTAEANRAWDWAVSKMRDIRPLHFPSYSPGSRLETFSDASKHGWGGLLVEFRPNDPRPYIIMCVSGTFTPAQLGWSTIMKECFAVWATVRKLRQHLDGEQFIINMDHRDLLWSSMSANEVVRRMATDIQQYRFTMRHIDGETNVLADHISRAEHVSEQEFAELQERLAARALPRDHRSPSPARVGHQQRTAPEAPAPEHDEAVTDQSESSWVGSVELESGSEFSVAGCGPDEPVSGSDSEASDTSQNLEAPPPARLSVSRSPIPIQRQPEPPANPQPAAAQAQPGAIPDDNLPIPHLQPHPEPEARILPAERYHLISSYHGGVNAHQGVRPLVQALREGGHIWATMEDDCRSFVIRCHHCQLERLNRRGAAALPYRSVLLPSRLFEVWNFDIIGPLQVCGLTGAKFIFVGIEETSKFLMLGYGVSLSAVELLFFLLECFKIFGLPLIIKSDLGVQFISKLIREFCAATGIQQKFGVAHRHQSDGVVENGVKLVWQYLRLAVHDLKKYDAWTPLLCNVQLGCNALTRDVLGGASASTLVFNRKVKPLRFLRSEDLPLAEDPAASSPTISTFIADNAAAQLDLLHRADVTKTTRFTALQRTAQEQRLRAEEAEELDKLDWVKPGILVSIPQPEAPTRTRPEKMSMRRRGPYKVMECSRDRVTVTLSDHHFPSRQHFFWPKELMWPYHEDMSPALPVDDLVGLPEELPELPIVCDVECANAILESRPLRETVVPDAPRHVRNHEYLVRWTGRPHDDVTWASYASVWSTYAFQDFILDSPLVGHVPPAAHALAHRRHALNLLTGTAKPDRRVSLADMSIIPRMLHYFPREMPRKPNRRALKGSQRQSVRFREGAIDSHDEYNEESESEGQ